MTVGRAVVVVVEVAAEVVPAVVVGTGVADVVGAFVVDPGGATVGPDDGAVVTLAVESDPLAVPEPLVHALSPMTTTPSRVPAPSANRAARYGIS